MSPKYNRTPHLPFSPGGTSDDRRLASVEGFLHTEIVLTEKMDGSNVCLQADGCFARSHASPPVHPSFDAFKAFHSTVKRLIPADYQIFGEWCFAKHSIWYNALPHHFLAFGVRDLTRDLWLSWDEVTMWAEELGVPTVPVLARESGFNREWKIRDLVEGHVRIPTRMDVITPSGKYGEREGGVLRKACSFKNAEFGKSVAKWVRKDHVQTDEHWKDQAIVRNLLRVQ